MKPFLVLSEYTDPCHHVKAVEQRVGQHEGPLYFITKDPRPLEHIITENKEREIVHITISGLGGTKLEPHAPKPSEITATVLNLIDILGDKLVIRIDPVIFGANHKRIFKVIETFKTAKRFKVSYCSLYPFVRQRFQQLGLPMNDGKFHYPLTMIQKHSKMLADATEKIGATLEYCGALPEVAPALDKRIKITGCVGAEEYKRLHLKPTAAQRSQRQQCLCLAKTEGLPEFKSCKHGCVYCYFSKNAS